MTSVKRPEITTVQLSTKNQFVKDGINAAVGTGTITVKRAIPVYAAQAQ
jgi:hypothetical protein